MNDSNDADARVHLREESTTAMQLEEACQQVEDSDDEERLEELAEREETSYWSIVDTSLQDEAMPVDVDEAGQASTFATRVQAFVDVSRNRTRMDILEAPGVNQHDTLQDDEEFLLPKELVQTIQPSSPDPLDLLGLPDQGDPESRIEETGRPAVDEDYGMPFDEPLSVALSPVVPQEASLPILQSSTSPPPARARSHSVLSDEELPTLTELLGRPKGTLSSAKRPITTPSVTTTSASPSLPPAPRAPSSVASSRSASTSLAIPSGSTGPTSPAIHQQARDTSEDASLAQELAGGRQLRKRTAVQLNPYQAEFAKYVTVAKRNQWDGIIIPAGLNLHKERTETPEEKAARLERRKKQKIDTQGGWLELEDGEGIPSSSADSQPLLSRSSSDIIGLNQDSRISQDIRPRSLSASLLKKGKQRAREPDGDTSEADSDSLDGPIIFSLGRPIKENKNRQDGKKKKKKTLPDANVYSKASTSKVTLDEALAEMQNKSRRKIGDNSRRREQTSNFNGLPTALRAGSAPPSSSPTRQSAAKTRLRAASSGAEKRPAKKRDRIEKNKNSVNRSQAPPIIDITDSSSSPHARKRTSKASARRRLSDRSAHSQEDSSEEGGSSNEEDGGRAAGDSPDRPFYKDDRFALKGSRKQAARKMMPAIFFKKAAADLSLMREETRAGKEVRETLRCSSDDAGSGEEGQNRNPAMATIRINPRNRDKPIQFVVDESTDESGSDANGLLEESEDERQTEATAAWANVLPVSRTSAATTPIQPRKGKKYWNGVIGNILMRDKLERQTSAGRVAGTSKRKRKKKTSSKRATSNPSAIQNSKGKERQKRLDHYRIHRPAIQLDDGDALMAALPAPQIPQPTLRVRKHPFKRSNPSSLSHGDKNEVLPHTKQRAPAVPLNQDHNLWDEKGSTFSRFSYDFDIHRLATGYTFAHDTYIAQGGLAELIQLAKPTPSRETYKRICTSFGIHIDSEMSPEVLLDLLPRLSENLYSALVDTEKRPHLHCPAAQILRFLAYYTHECLADDEAGQRQQAVILEALYALETRLDAWMLLQDKDMSAKMYNVVTFRWYMLEIAYRRYVRKSASGDSPSGDSEEDVCQQLLTERLDELVESLLHLGLGRPVKALKALSASEQQVDTNFSDPLAEIWICLLHLFAVEATDNEHNHLIGLRIVL